MQSDQKVSSKSQVIAMPNRPEKPIDYKLRIAWMDSDLPAIVQAVL